MEKKNKSWLLHSLCMLEKFQKIFSKVEKATRGHQRKQEKVVLQIQPWWLLQDIFFFFNCHRFVAFQGYECFFEKEWREFQRHFQIIRSQKQRWVDGLWWYCYPECTEWSCVIWSQWTFRKVMYEKINTNFIY